MTITRPFAPVAGALAMLSLAACGSDRGDASLASPTASQFPVETPADQATRASGLVGRIDSLIVSSIVGESTHPRFPTFQVETDCEGTRCSWSEPTAGFSGSFGLRDFRVSSGVSRALLTRNGITLLEGRGATVESYGAWMDHAVFALQNERTMVGGIAVSAHYGVAGGDLTGVAPDIAATWRGVMVGTTGGALGGRPLQGDAALHYTLGGAGGSLDAAFTDIRDLYSGAAHATPSLNFNGVPVAADGSYRFGEAGDRIQGGFYGPGHAEAAGIIERSGVVGAFGAKRQ